jgi:hypothetical protein
MRIAPQFLAHTCAAVVLGLFGSLTAWAQDYTVSSVTGQWVTPTSNATQLTLSNFGNNLDDGLATVQIPFQFAYFGKSYTSTVVGTNGTIWFGSSGYNQNYSRYNFPVSGTPPGDGMVSIAQYDLDGQAPSAACYYWTDGTAPNRRFVVAWTNWSQWQYQNTNYGPFNFQVQLYETSGRIQMAYTNWASTVGTIAKGCGLDEPGTTNRWVTPNGSSSYSFSGPPPNDWRFDPKVTNFSGTVLMDKYVVDGTGIGNVKELGQPASGLTVELRDSTNAVASTGITDATGAFALKGIALVGTQVGSLWVTGQTSACAVRATTGGASAGFQLASGVPFSADKVLGTVTITDANDVGGVSRAPLNIASTVQGVYDWCTSRTLKNIPFLEILYDSSSLPTTYSKPGASAAQMRISGGSANPDGWDRSIIRRTYARHVLGAVSGYPLTGFSNTYDAVSDDTNAFAEGFGYYLNAAVGGGSAIFYDGVSSSSSLPTNLEEPATPLASPRGPNVAAWCALSLYDLTDPANEAWDLIDGTGSAVDRPFLTVATLTAAPTADAFYARWAILGYDATSLSTSFIRHGMLADDADEPNDTGTTPKSLTQFGFIRQARVLNMFNEDWYSFIMPQPTNRLAVNVAFDRTNFNTTIVCQIYDAAGSVIATANPLSPLGAFQAVTGALPSGTYRIRIQHNGGVRLPSYEVSAFSELAFSAAALAPWTVGRPVNLPVNIKGGIPPYTLSIEPAAATPPGLILDGVNARVTGVPSRAGFYDFILAAGDAANPKNVAAGPQSFRVNPVLELTFGEFVALPHDSDVDTRAAYVGGTAPYTTTVDAGGLPDGVAIDPQAIRFTGHTDTAGSFPVTLTSTDVAGSTATQSVTAVVCSASGAVADMATGRAACGYWFDAVKGSVVKVGVKTVSKMPKRALRVQVIDADGVTALDAKTTGRKGSASVSGFVAPSTGRFYVVVASDEGEATQLVGAVKVTPTKKGSGENPDMNFVAGKQYIVRLGALEGAKLTFTAKPDGGTGLALKPVYLIDPEGQIRLVDLENEVKTAGGSFTITKTLDMSGTWQVIVGAQPGPQGHFKYSYRIAEPKGASYQAD